ncbi:MAG: transcription-repair coupling factor, partial [Lentisphaeria bacterium]|nr:transcription-repair coupling factor [Lentisphaeria bacterium]
MRDLPIEAMIARLGTGVLIPPAKLAILSERELFGRTIDVRRRRQNRYRVDQAIHGGTELEEGAFAIHVSHGICQYHGIRELETNGELQEVMELEFAEEARVYVPLEQAHLVSRYMGGTRKAPKLSRIGGMAWRNAKDSAADAAWDLAAELLRIEALREHAHGRQLKPSPDWEHAFASAFPYTETEDQAEAIQQVLADMAGDKPMDRLLCGDVGYGKTEVAMRAAFRAVANGKQVGVLVPTTVLAQQHYNTFRERMSEYPFEIEMISRFRTKAEQRRILDRVTAGTVDIVIGTHRLLQKDVAFADLGLLVIDEEQRFGVLHKQKLKQMRASVDILTMTATPIPRTLYFSLSGIRNLSTIMSAPAERLPVHTVVAQYDADLIQQAIHRELERKGQVFFLHNRVQSIDRIAFRLQTLVPEARFAVGHGQMGAGELEAVMSSFVRGEVDVLVCTTIIESGIDIPNANTIFIDDANRFGLAELYQLRGRVGRYHRQAYAYLLLPPIGMLTGDAKERLTAIRKYTHLGAGFKLALRDLEIRGAGNILGAEQSGHIAAVGFDLYCDLLRDAVARLGNKPEPHRLPLPVEIDTLVFGHADARGRTRVGIPKLYVQDEPARVETYRRISRLETEQAAKEMEEELTDRFGRLPVSTQCLLMVSRVRILARAA